MVVEADLTAATLAAMTICRRTAVMEAHEKAAISQHQH
jgi:hypothetical protein